MKYLWILLPLLMIGCDCGNKPQSESAVMTRSKKLCSCKGGINFIEYNRHATCVDGTKIHWVMDKVPVKVCSEGY